MRYTSAKDYREILRNAFEERISKNSRYSLRAFARDIGVAPQNLSFILRDKKGLSQQSALRVAERLGMEPNEVRFFCDLVALNQAKSESTKKVAQLRLLRYQNAASFHSLPDDVFRVIADWYHYAILEMTFLKGFRPEEKYIVTKLGISIHEARQALSRLKRLKLLKFEGGIWKKIEVNTATSTDVPSSAIQRFHSQVLSKAIEALQTQSVDERDFSSLVMAIDPGRIPEAKALIKDFRRKLMSFLEAGGRGEIYVYSTQLFRMNTKENR